MSSKILKLKPILSTIIEEDSGNPFVAQLISIKKMDNKPGSDISYVTNISDSEKYIKCRFLNKAAELIHKKKISQFSILKIYKYKIVKKEGTVFIIVLNVSEYEDKNSIVGSPSNYSSSQHFATGDSLKVKTSEKSVDASNKKRIKAVDEDKENVSLTPIIQISPMRSVPLTMVCIGANKAEKFFQAAFTDGKHRIKLIGFGETINKLSSILEPGNIYGINHYTTRLTRGQDNMKTTGIFALPEAEYELTANKNIEIEHKGKDHGLITSGIVPLSDIVTAHETTTTMNVMGFVTAAFEPVELTTKNTQKKILKRDIKIVDFSNEDEPTRVTLWEPFSKMEIERNCVYFFGNLMTNNFNDIISLGSARSSFIIKEPEISKTKEIYKAAETRPINSNTSNVSVKIAPLKDCYPLRSILRDNLISYSSALNKNKINNFSTALTVQEVSAADGFYFGCTDCKKKVAFEGEPEDYADVTAYCENCAETKLCVPKVVMKLVLSDFSSSIYCTFFSDVMEHLFQVNTAALFQMYVKEPRDFTLLLNTLVGKTMKLLLKKVVETYNGTERDKFTCLKVEFLDGIELAKQYLDILEA